MESSELWEAVCVGVVISLVPSLLRGILYLLIPALHNDWYGKRATETVTILLTILLTMTEVISPIITVSITLPLFAVFLMLRLSAMNGDRAFAHLHSMTENRLRYLDHFRGDFMLSTCVAILAVDFDVFPSRFSKSDTYGTSVMDLGPGGIVFAGGLVASLARHRTHLSTLRSARCLLLMGVMRLISTSAISYQVEVNEYGKHWNFFFTLSGVQLVRTLLPSQPHHILFITFPLILLYQVVLNRGLSAIVHSHDHEGSLLMQDKEGICSLLGYCCIYGFGYAYSAFLTDSATYCLSQVQAKGRKETVMAAKKWLVIWLLWIGSFIGFLSFLTAVSLNWIEPPSRRACNLTYVLWISTYQLCQCFCKILLQISDVEQRVHISSAINRNLFGTFLLANVLTGLVNITFNTHEQTAAGAYSILGVYSLSIVLSALVADSHGVYLKV